MNCDRNSATLAMYLDGELPPEQVTRLQEHIGECSHCAAEIAELVSLKQSLRVARNQFPPNLEFRRKIRQQITKPKHSPWLTYFVPAITAVVILIMAAIGWTEYSRRSDAFSEVADLHIATLASVNPVDVLSTDRHTVKPWFQGRVPFSFNLPELNGTGFTLIGGREVFLHQSPGAQLLFSLRQHKISILIFQESSEMAQALPSHTDAERRNSFSMETWRAQGLRFLIIGDADTAEIHKLAQAMKAVNS
jgi:anti-sigma factor RsiW